MTGPRLSYEDFLAQDLSPDAFTRTETPQRRAGDKPRGFRTPEQIERLNANDAAGAEEEMATDRATTRGKVLGTLAAPLSEVPGGGLLQRGISGDATKDAIASAPAAARIPAKLLGGVAAVGAMPVGAARLGKALPRIAPALKAATGSAVAQGATYGGLSGLLDEADDTALERTGRVAGGAVLGAAGGKVGEVVGNTVRSYATKALGKTAGNLDKLIGASDEEMYQIAANEAKARPMNAALAKVLKAPDVAPYTATVRGSRTLKGANTSEQGAAVYKLLNERERNLGKMLRTSDDFKAGSALEKQDILAAKRDLLSAADASMPGLRPAAQRHAKLMSEEEAFEQGAKIGRQLSGYAKTPVGKLGSESPEAFEESIADMTPEQAKAALKGIFGSIKETRRFTANPLSGFGVLSSPVRSLNAVDRNAPLLRKLDERAGVGSLSRLLEALGASGATP